MDLRHGLLEEGGELACQLGHREGLFWPPGKARVPASGYSTLVPPAQETAHSYLPEWY